MPMLAHSEFIQRVLERPNQLWDESRGSHTRRVREPAPRRRQGRVTVLGPLILLVALCLVRCSDPLGGVPVGQPTATTLLSATATATLLSPNEELQTEIATGATLHGHIWGMDVQPWADGTQVTIRDALITPSLVDAQSDVYQMFQAIWTASKYRFHRIGRSIWSSPLAPRTRDQKPQSRSRT